MTFDEALKELKTFPINCLDFKEKLALSIVLETLEEFKTLKEKSEPKKMSIGNDNGRARKCCGNCGCFVLPTSNYCSKCGQKLDWQ